MKIEHTLISKKRTMMKTNKANIILILIIIFVSDISFDATPLSNLISHLIVTAIAVYMIIITVRLNIEFIKLLEEENIKRKKWEYNFWVNMISLLIAVLVSYFFLNDNLPKTYSITIFLVIPIIILFPLFHTYHKVSMIDLHKEKS